MIGGEFPLAVTDILNAKAISHQDDECYCYASGRAALYQILRYLIEQKQIFHVLLPDYLCSTILLPIQKLDLSYSFFPLNEKLELEPEGFKQTYRNNTAVLLINYFGLQDLTPQTSYIRSLDENAIIIEDDVQAYYEFKKPLGDVDFKYTSLRKTFAIPDGGLVKTNYPLPIIEKRNTFGQYKAAAALMKSIKVGNFDDSVYLDISKIGGSKIDDELDYGMSLISERLYACLDEEDIKLRRQANARYLVEKLGKKGVKFLLPLRDDKVPLFVSIVLDNRDAVRKAMFQHEVFCPVHWPTEETNAIKGIELAKKELSLIVDQRYDETDMDLIISFCN